MRAGEGEPGTIMEAFKPGTGPADSYWVIGMDDGAAGSPAARSRRRPTRRSSRAAAAFTEPRRRARRQRGRPSLYSRGRASLWSAPPIPRISAGSEQRMRAEIENLVDEIKQAISLLRRHL